MVSHVGPILSRNQINDDHSITVYSYLTIVTHASCGCTRVALKLASRKTFLSIVVFVNTLHDFCIYLSLTATLQANMCFICLVLSVSAVWNRHCAKYYNLPFSLHLALNTSKQWLRWFMKAVAKLQAILHERTVLAHIAAHLSSMHVTAWQRWNQQSDKLQLVVRWPSSC